MDAKMGGTDARAWTRGGSRMRAGGGGVQAAWDLQQTRTKIINQATQMTEERMENTQTVKEMR